MGLTDSSKAVLKGKIELLREQIEKANTLIEDYNQRIDVLQTERAKKMADREVLIKQINDLKTDTEKTN